MATNRPHSMLHPSPFAKFAAGHAVIKAALDSANNIIIIRNPTGFSVIDLELEKFASRKDTNPIELCSRLLAGPVSECMGMVGDRALTIDFLRRFCIHGKQHMGLVHLIEKMGVSEKRQQEQIEVVMGMLRGLGADMLATHVQRKTEIMQPGEYFSFRPGWIKPPQKRPTLRLVNPEPKKDD